MDFKQWNFFPNIPSPIFHSFSLPSNRDYYYIVCVPKKYTLILCKTTNRKSPSNTSAPSARNSWRIQSLLQPATASNASTSSHGFIKIIQIRSPTYLSPPNNLSPTFPSNKSSKPTSKSRNKNYAWPKSVTSWHHTLPRRNKCDKNIVVGNKNSSKKYNSSPMNNSPTVTIKGKL